jgi:hypothetical protein
MCVAHLSHFHRRCWVEALCEVSRIIETSSSLLHYYIQILSTYWYLLYINPFKLYISQLPSYWPYALLLKSSYNQACSTFSLYSTSSSPSLVVRIEWI